MKKNLESYVREFHENGLQVIPANQNDRKTPSVQWKKYHEENYKNTDSDINVWLSQGWDGYFVLTGKTSNNLVVLDFDANERVECVFEEFMATAAGEILKDAPVVVTGSQRGRHIYFFTEEDFGAGKKLAYKPDGQQCQILIETRASKQYAAMPFSLHKSGNCYTSELHPADFIASIPTISNEDFESLIAIAMTFDECETHKVVEVVEKVERKVYPTDTPINRYNKENDIVDVLERYGYTFASKVNQNELNYCRPGKEEGSGVSVHLDKNTSWHYSSSDRMGVSERPATPFDLLAMYEFDGNIGKAVKSLTNNNNGAIEVEKEKKVLMPELPEYARLDYSVGKDACPWMNEYIEYSKSVASLSASTFHQATALFLMSTVAAGRVVGEKPGMESSALYIMLLARSTVFGKSYAANTGIKVLKAANLDGFLMGNKTTPQKYIESISTQGHAKGLLNEHLDGSQKYELRRKFPSQRGWYYDEFGDSLQAMLSKSGPMSEFFGHFKTFFDGYDDFESGTLDRGIETAENIHLSLLCSTTPKQLRNVAPIGSELWGDGSFARFLLVTPAIDEEAIEELPDEEVEYTVPNSLRDGLAKWHYRLNVPKINTNKLQEYRKQEAKKFDKKKNDDDSNDGLKVTPQEIVSKLPKHVIGFSPEAYEAYRNYFKAIRQLVRENEYEDLGANYDRLKTIAMRIAMLFASFADEEEISIAHWTKAQEICEEYRNLLHYVPVLMKDGEKDKANQKEARFDKILDFVASQKNGVGANNIHKFKFKGKDKLTIDEVNKLLTEMVELELLIGVSNTHPQNKKVTVTYFTPETHQELYPVLT